MGKNSYSFVKDKILLFTLKQVYEDKLKLRGVEEKKRKEVKNSEAAENNEKIVEL